MKPYIRIALVAAIAAALPAAAHAQGAVALKAGMSFGNVSNRGVLPGNLGTRSGFAVGLSLGTGKGLVGFRLEGLYAQRGVTAAVAGDARKLDYLDVPVLLQVTVPAVLIAPYAYAGPQASFELKCTDGSGTCADTGRPTTSYAAVIGAGVKLGALGAFSLEGRYIYGLSDLKLSTVTSTQSYQTRSFLVLIGVGF